MNLIKYNPEAYFSAKSEPKAVATEKSIEISNSNSNIVVSHIENFVAKKHKKEMYKKQLNNMKRQLLRHSVIR